MTSVFQMMRLEGRRALITGAAGGLGNVFAETLGEMGAELLLVDRLGTSLDEQAQNLAAGVGCKASSFYCDLEQEDERALLIQAVTKSYPAVSILVNNAAFVGTSDLEGWSVGFEQQTTQTWRRAVEVNLTAAFDLCRGFAPILRRSPGASVINIGSIYGFMGPDWRLYEQTAMANPAAYAASKGGLLQLTRWLATTMAPEVRVNMISPGGVFRGQDERFVRRYAERTPLGRMADENDFRGIVAYLSSDLSAYVTGQNLAVDGGWGVW